VTDAGGPVTIGEIARGLLRVEAAVTEMHREIVGQLTHKADKADLARLEGRLDSHESQLSEMRQAAIVSRAVATADRVQSDDRRLTRRQTIAVSFGAVGVSASLVASYANLFLHH
jgi:hypothetical protein